MYVSAGRTTCRSAEGCVWSMTNSALQLEAGNTSLESVGADYLFSRPKYSRDHQILVPRCSFARKCVLAAVLTVSPRCGTSPKQAGCAHLHQPYGRLLSGMCTMILRIDEVWPISYRRTSCRTGALVTRIVRSAEVW